MKLFRTENGPVIEHEGRFYSAGESSWDDLLAREDVGMYLRRLIERSQRVEVAAPVAPLAPILHQEVWAAGVTYLRSREARREESQAAGGGDVYDRVYAAERPELFFKAAGQRVVGPGGTVRIRRDSRWNVPEPELTLLLAATGKITGYTIGNDMSSRDIEGENPLYLPQAKIYDGACALGPCILLSDDPLPPTTPIAIRIARGGREIFSGATEIARIKRNLATLAEYLFRELSFPQGCFLLTGTGVVPGDSFTLQSGDGIAITIAPIGTLENTVTRQAAARPRKMRRTVKGHAMLRCPVCQEMMVEVEEAQVNAASCPGCRGTWISGLALDRRTRLEAAPDQPHLTLASLPELAETVLQSDSTAPLACPSCKQIMRKGRFHPKIPVQIDRCERCNQIWLDAGEQGMLLKLYRELTAGQQPSAGDAARIDRMNPLQNQPGYGRRSSPAAQNFSSDSSGSVGEEIAMRVGCEVVNMLIGLLVSSITSSRNRQ